MSLQRGVERDEAARSVALFGDPLLVDSVQTIPRCSTYGIFMDIYLHLGRSWGKCR